MLIETIASIALATSAPNPATATQVASPQSEQSEPHRLEDLIVTGRHRDAIIRDFVENVADPVRGRSLARWNNEVCVSVNNLKPELAHFVVERVSHVAREVGLRTGGPRCQPNLIIIASDKPNDEARTLVDRYHRQLRPNITGSARGAGDLANFQNTDAPVRWWYVNQVSNLDGQRAFRAPGDDPDKELPITTTIVASRLLTNHTDDIKYAVVIIDPTRMEHMNALQLADYIGLVGLAQIAPEADTTSYDSILNVVSSETDTPQLTDWDWAYLKGLYTTTRSRSDPRASRLEIRASIARAADRLSKDAGTADSD